jgi:CRP/FNR family transcriptional regulator, cyclic AMP receptor protein
MLRAAGLEQQVADCGPADILFTQGDPCDTVLFLERGAVLLSVLAPTGKEAVVATAGPGEFLGESALQGHAVRLETATALVASTVLVLPRDEMRRLLHTQSAFVDVFLAHMLVRNARLEAALIDQLFNSSEKRLARALLLLARHGAVDQPRKVIPPVTQAVLAEMVGTTRPRVNFFLNKFRKAGFIDYQRGKLTVNPSLFTVVLDE